MDMINIGGGMVPATSEAQTQTDRSEPVRFCTVYHPSQLHKLACNVPVDKYVPEKIKKGKKLDSIDQFYTTL